jgi:hypothetical protein
MFKKKLVTQSDIRRIVKQELMKESKGSDDSNVKPYEISAAATKLLDAISDFNSLSLPEVPDELSSSLSSAISILKNMENNPGQYNGGVRVENIKPNINYDDE